MTTSIGWIGADKSSPALVASKPIMKKTETKPTRVHRRPVREAAVEDYAWRFRLVRSTLEDFNQLDKDRNGGPDAKQPRTSLPAMGDEIGRPGVNPNRLRLPAMTL
jgi:hypothetical protein